MIRLKCPDCSKSLAVADTAAGKAVLCPQCRRRIAVPKIAAAAEDDAIVEERKLPSPRRQPQADDRSPRAAVRAREDDYEDDDEDEIEESRPKVKKKKRKSSAFKWIGNFLARLPIPFRILAVLASVSIVLAFIHPIFYLAPLFVGCLMVIVGALLVLLYSFNVSFMEGLACLVVPFYVFYFIFSNWQEMKLLFFFQLAGMATIFCFMLAIPIHLLIYPSYFPSNRNPAVEDRRAAAKIPPPVQPVQPVPKPPVFVPPPKPIVKIELKPNVPHEKPLNPAPPIKPPIQIPLEPPPPPDPRDNPNIVASEPFNLVVFSRTSPRVVVVAEKAIFGAGKYRTYNADTRTMIAEFDIKKSIDNITVNDDGTMLAGNDGFNERVIDFVNAAGDVVQVPFPPFPGGLFFDFTANKNFFVVYSEGGVEKYFVVDPKTRKNVAVWQGPPETGVVRAIAPDRKHYASVIGASVVVRDFDTLKPVAQLPFAPKTLRGSGGVQGLAFSLGGGELALFAQDGGKSRIVFWDWKKGQLVRDFFFDNAFSGTGIVANERVQPIEWLPDDSGWVVRRKFMIDKATGKERDPLPVTDGEWNGIRRLLAPDVLLVARQHPGNRKTLELIRIEPLSAELKKAP